MLGVTEASGVVGSQRGRSLMDIRFSICDCLGVRSLSISIDTKLKLQGIFPQRIYFYRKILGTHVAFLEDIVKNDQDRGTRAL